MTDTTQPRLTCRTDRALIRAGGRSERFVLVELEAPTVARDASRRRPPVNLAFVIDRSGSMQGRGKLDVEAVTRAVMAVLDNGLVRSAA